MFRIIHLPKETFPISHINFRTTNNLFVRKSLDPNSFSLHWINFWIPDILLTDQEGWLLDYIFQRHFRI